MKLFQNPMKLALAQIKLFADDKVNSIELTSSFLWKVRIYTIVVLAAFSMMVLLIQ